MKKSVLKFFLQGMFSMVCHPHPWPNVLLYGKINSPKHNTTHNNNHCNNNKLTR
jgi:hypothetical protein